MSANYSICNNFLGSGEMKKGTLFWIKSSSARPITQFSIYRDEDEFILLPATKVQIISKTIDLNNNNITIVMMEEIPTVHDSKYITRKISVVGFRAEQLNSNNTQFLSSDQLSCTCFYTDNELC